MTAPRLIVVLLAALGLFKARAAEMRLPPITGELSGDFLPVKIAGAPVVHWTIKLDRGEEEKHLAVFTAEGPGLHVRAGARVDASGTPETWRVDEAKIDLTPWLGTVVPDLAEKFSGLSVTGILEASGEGTLQEGRPGGRATLRLHDGRIDDPAHKLLLEGIVLEASAEDIALRRVAPVRLTWTGGHYDVVALGEGHVACKIDGEEIRVEEASVLVLGGELKLGAFTFSLSRPEAEVTARVVGVDIALFLPLLPPVVTEAKGRLDGRVKLKRDASGVQIGVGRLALRKGESAVLRLAPTPGLLSASLPAAALKYYPAIGGIEKGEVPLKADVLEVTFTPAGDKEGRTAFVHVAGGPVDPKLHTPIDLSVNVNGPLETLVKFGTDSRLRFR